MGPLFVTHVFPLTQRVSPRSAELPYKNAGV
ncbi:ORFL9W_IRL [Human betaherpesvirus 5]|nr:ORFL9C [Human betaherpesvirus 5]QHX40298.1 ORFL9C_TRL [Human betaherpesvirus 5]QHX40674.1 ORFL9W_IRL [Human betaherpesvirus 5]